MSPFTSLIAFSICLSSFNGKLIWEWVITIYSLKIKLLARFYYHAKFSFKQANNCW
jgi:hypothetical protein